MVHDPLTAATALLTSLPGILAAVANEFGESVTPAGISVMVAIVAVYFGLSCFTAIINHVALKFLSAFCRHCWSAALLAAVQVLFVSYYMPQVSMLVAGDLQQNATAAWNDLLARVEPIGQTRPHAVETAFRDVWEWLLG